jgi:hypothetical protein
MGIPSACRVAADGGPLGTHGTTTNSWFCHQCPCRYPHPKTDDPAPDEELDRLLDHLEDAGLVERDSNAQGQATMRLTKQGEQIANQLTLTDEASQDELMAALLEER